MAADASNGYVVNFSVYLKSERKNRRIHSLGYDVVMKMAHPFFNGNHHLFFDNYLSSPSLLDHLLDQQTYARSTERCTRKDLPPCTKNKLRQLGETVIWQRESRLFTKWHNKRDLALIFGLPMCRQNELPRMVQHTQNRQMFKLGSYLSLMRTPKIWVALIEQISYDLPTRTDGSRESGIDVSFGRKKEEICLVQNYWEENYFV